MPPSILDLILMPCVQLSQPNHASSDRIEFQRIFADQHACTTGEQKLSLEKEYDWSLQCQGYRTEDLLWNYVEVQMKAEIYRVDVVTEQKAKSL